MRVSEEYSASRFYKLDDFEENGEVQVVIVGVRKEQMQDGAEKNVLHFTEEPALVLNPTNAKFLGKHLGDDMDDWAGCTIELSVDH